MKIVYAPTLNPIRAYSLDNIIQGFDIQVLETLCDILDEAPEFGGGGIYYLSPHCEAITQSTLAALNDRGKITPINSLENLQDTCCMVTTTSFISYSYAFYYHKPVIFFLPAFSGIEFNSSQSAILKVFGIFTHSLKSLREQVIFCARDLTMHNQIYDFIKRSLL